MAVLLTLVYIEFINVCVWGGGGGRNSELIIVHVFRVDCSNNALKFCSRISSSLRRAKLRPEDMTFSLSNGIG